MHYRIGLSEFSRADYSGYLRVNRRFAQALAGLLEPDDNIWVHVYHLLPLAAEASRVGRPQQDRLFHHIPWPAPEVLNTLPGSFELLNAMLDYDLIGMQTDRDADNLRRNLLRELRATPVGEAGVSLGVRATVIKDFSIGIDVDAFQKAAARGNTQKLVRQAVAGLGHAVL